MTGNPADTAKLDQDLAEWNNHLDTAISELREQVSRSGEFQGFANLALGTTMLTDNDRHNLLLAAIWRLAKQDGAGEPWTPA